MKLQVYCGEDAANVLSQSVTIPFFAENMTSLTCSKLSEAVHTYEMHLLLM